MGSGNERHRQQLFFILYMYSTKSVASSKKTTFYLQLILRIDFTRRVVIHYETNLKTIFVMLLRGEDPWAIRGERDASPVLFGYIGHVTGSIVLII